MTYGSLQITRATGQQRVLALDKPTVRIGRGEENDLVLNDNRVSRNHAEILCDPDGLKILDLGSANGTYVDGARLLSQFPEPLNEGSTIQIGGTRMRVSLAAGPPARRGPGDTEVDAPNASLLESLLTSPLGTPKTTPPLNIAPASRKPESPPPGPPSAGLHVAISAQELSVEPGDAVAFGVAVTNRSDIVDSVTLQLGGVPSGWVTVTPAEVRLFPSDKAEFQVLVRPPRVSASKAGSYPVAFVARSAQRPDLPVKAAGLLTVEPFHSDRLELEPKKQTGWLGAPFNMRLINEGNAPQQYDLEGTNDENAMRFRFTPPVGRADPGEVATVRARAGVRAWRIMGRPRSFQFQLTASPAKGDLQPLTGQGTFVQDPPFPPWLIPLLLGIMLLSCCIVLFVFREPIRGVVLGKPTVDPSVPTPVSPGAALQTAIATVFPDQANDLGTAQAGIDQTTAALGAAQQLTAESADIGQQQTIAALMEQGTAAAQGNAQTQTAFALNVAPTITALVLANEQNLTSIALGFDATRTAIANENMGTQTSIAIAMGQLLTTQALSSTVVAQTQTAFALANGETQTAIAGLSAAQQTAFAQTATAQADQTGTAIAGLSAAQQTAFAQTQTAIVTGQQAGFAQTQTIEALHRTQTAVAAPSPTPTATPQAFDRAIALQPNGTPLYPNRFELTGNEFAASQDMTLCLYDPSPPGPPPPANNDTQSNGALTLSISDEPDSAPLGSLVTYTITLTDTSNGGFSGGVFTIRASPQIIITSASTSANVVCPLVSGVATCTTTGLGNITITVMTQARSAGQGSVTVGLSATPVPPSSPEGPIVRSTLQNTVLSITARTTIYAPPTPVPGLPDCGLPRLSSRSVDLQAVSSPSMLQVKPVFYPAATTNGQSPFAIITADRGPASFTPGAIALINFQRDVANARVSFYYPLNTLSQYVMIAYDATGTEVSLSNIADVRVPNTYTMIVSSQGPPIRQVAIVSRGNDTPPPPLFITGVEIRYTDSLIRP